MSQRTDLGYGKDDGKYGRKITSPIWNYGIVLSTDDPENAGRIKVRVPGDIKDGLDGLWGGTSVVDVVQQVASSLTPEQLGALPWCEPLLPKFINVVPKIGEMVKIVTFDYRDKKLRRQYVGPVIGQQTALDLRESGFNYAKSKVEQGAYVANWSLNPEALDGSWKLYPDKEDISILGRINTDLILRDTNLYNEITLRSGKIDANSLKSAPTRVSSPYILNKKNPAYVSINFTQAEAFNNSTNPEIKKLNLQNDRSHINFVADNLNLISYKGSNRKGFTRTILKGEDILNQVDTETKKLHPLVYGDVLWEFLSVLRPYVEGHIHKASRREPDGDISKNNLIKWFEDNMGASTPEQRAKNDFGDCNFLSKGVKTN
jgi:hypothetical protein